MDAALLPLDRTSRVRLAEDGLVLTLVDASDREELTAWETAQRRGFHRPHADPRMIEVLVRTAAYRRMTAVLDGTAADPVIPVATASSWVADLSVPGGSLPTWAISFVTVAPTHRRRGIARALLEAELRTAHEAGIPIASLTATEATLYERYGFGRATRRLDLSIDTSLVRWAGPHPAGRVHVVTPDLLASTGRDAVDRALRATPGEISLDDVLWEELSGTLETEPPHPLRALRYDDESGTAQGVAVYVLLEDPEDYQRHTVEVRYLRAATDEGHAALWHLILDLDLVRTVRVRYAAVDDPVTWCVDNPRAVRSVSSDLHWLRILDVPAALTARSYASPLDLVLDVADPLGLAEGRFHLESSPGRPSSVTRTERRADIELGVSALSSLLLGGERATALRAAGRLVERTAGAVHRTDVAFSTVRAPFLSFDY